MLFLHWEYATTYAFHSLLLYENQSYLSSYLTSKREARATEERERERERKRKVAMPSQKEAREGKLLKGVPLPPNISHTFTS